MIRDNRPSVYLRKWQIPFTWSGGVARKAARMTQEELGTAVGVTRRQISRYESGDPISERMVGLIVKTPSH